MATYWLKYGAVTPYSGWMMQNYSIYDYTSQDTNTFRFVSQSRFNQYKNNPEYGIGWLHNMGWGMSFEIPTILKLEKNNLSSAPTIYLDVLVTNLSIRSLETTRTIPNSSILCYAFGQNRGTYSEDVDWHNGDGRPINNYWTSWVANSSQPGGWAYMNYRDLGSTYHFTIAFLPGDDDPDTNYGTFPSFSLSFNLSYTIGLGYTIPSAETKITAAKAQQYSELLSAKRYSQLTSTYKPSAGSLIIPQPYLGSNGYTNSNIAKNKIIYDERQNEIITYLGSKTFRCAET